MEDGQFLIGAQFLVLTAVVTCLFLIRLIRARLGYNPALRFVKHHRNVFGLAANQLGLSRSNDSRDERNARIPGIRRLRATALQASQVRTRYTGQIGGLPVEVLDWSNNVFPLAHQETIVILPFDHEDDEEEPVQGSLIAGEPLACRPMHRPIDEFEEGLADLNGLYAITDDRVADLVGAGNLPVLVAAAKSTAPFEIRFQPGEMVFAQSLISLRDEAKPDEMSITLDELSSDHRVARDSEFVVETVKRAITLHAALSMATSR